MRKSVVELRRWDSHLARGLRTLPLAMVLMLTVLWMSAGCAHLNVPESPDLTDPMRPPVEPSVLYRPADTSVLQPSVGDLEALTRPRLKLGQRTKVAVWTEPGHNLSPAVQDEALRTLLGREANIVDLERGPLIGASMQTKAGNTQVALEGQLPDLLHFAPIVKTDYVWVLRLQEIHADDISLTEDAYYDTAALETYGGQFDKYIAMVDTWFEETDAAVDGYVNSVHTAIAEQTAAAKEEKKSIPPWETDGAKRRASRFRQGVRELMEEIEGQRMRTRETGEMAEELPDLAKVSMGSMMRVTLRAELVDPRGPDVKAIWTVEGTSPTVEEAARLAVRRLAEEVQP